MRTVIGMSLVALGLFGHADVVAEVATITLATGESLKVTIVEHHDASVTVEHTVLGVIEIPLSGISDIAEPETEPQRTSEPSNTDAPLQTTAASVSTAPSFWATLFPDFESQFELGGSGSAGNTKTGDVRIGLRTERENEVARMKFGGTYQQSTSRGTTVRNQANAFMVHDWLFPNSPWFTFVSGNYDYDQFRAWNHRVSGFGGVGYSLAKHETFEVATRIGGGLTREFGGNNELRPEGLVSAALIKWKPSDAQTVSASATLYPDLSEFFEFRFLAGLEWLVTIDQADGLNLKLGIENEYESNTAYSKRDNDLKYYGALVLEF